MEEPAINKSLLANNIVTFLNFIKFHIVLLNKITVPHWDNLEMLPDYTNYRKHYMFKFKFREPDIYHEKI